MTIRNLYVLFITCTISTLASAQLKGPSYGRDTVEIVNRAGNNLFYSEFPFTAIAFSFPEEYTFQGAYVILAEKDTIALSSNDHSPITDGFRHSNLISFDTALRSFEFNPGAYEGVMLLHRIDGALPLDKTIHSIQNKNAGNSGCEEPPSISQAEWRQGLNQPNYSRNFASPNHMIVHHSAGSNSNTNYAQVVRDIYIFHTQVNGWSDIGYNYLIAQDGTIFKGRDPESGDQDEVVGAHFCGKNTGTMGICLLGTYTSISPTTDAIQSLVELLSWKLDKEGFGPNESFPFSDPSSLGSVVGHRDGCATECPGQMTYGLLPQLRNDIQLALDHCDGNAPLVANFDVSEERVERGNSVSFRDRSLGNPNRWQWLFEGGVPSSDQRSVPTRIAYPESGSYDATLIIYNAEGQTDTLVKRDLINVFSADLPRIYPNPLSQGQDLQLEVEFPEDIISLSIHDLLGKHFREWRPLTKVSTLDTSGLPSGIYVMEFRTASSTSALLLTIQ